MTVINDEVHGSAGVISSVFEADSDDAIVMLIESVLAHDQISCLLRT